MESSSKSPFVGKRFAFLICTALLTVFAITSWLAIKDRCATVDETRHLVGAWVQTFAGDFRCDYDNPPIWKYYFALGRSEQDLALNRQSVEWDGLLGNENPGAGNFVVDTLFGTPGNNIDNILNPSRARMLVLGCVLGALIAGWAWKLRGPIAGIVAATAFALDPNFLGHSPLVDNDVSTALAFFAVILSSCLICERATVPRIIAAGLILGAALVTKYSCVIAIPAIFGILLCRAMMKEPWKVFGKSLAGRSRRLAVAAGIVAFCIFMAWAGLWACYGFRFEMSADPQRHFNEDSVTQMVRSAEMRFVPQSASAIWQPSLFAQAGQFAMRHRILPEAWVAGNLYIYSYSRTRDAFLLGQISPNGWWYYFPLAMLFKTPVCTLVGLAAAIVLWLKWYRRTNPWILAAAIIGPAFYMTMAIASRYNIGLRHILAAYPFLFVFLGIIAGEAWAKNRKSAKWIIGSLMLGLAIETFSAFPDYIAFFNFASGGERGGLKLLSDSNLDWGQDLTLLADWEKSHPNQAVDFILFTGVDPLHYGIRPPVKDRRPGSALAVSATYLQGTYGDADFRAEMAELRQQKPIAVLGGSIYVFEIVK